MCGGTGSHQGVQYTSITFGGAVLDEGIGPVEVCTSIGVHCATASLRVIVVQVAVHDVSFRRSPIAAPIPKGCGSPIRFAAVNRQVVQPRCCQPKYIDAATNIACASTICASAV